MELFRATSCRLKADIHFHDKGPLYIFNRVLVSNFLIQWPILKNSDFYRLKIGLFRIFQRFPEREREEREEREERGERGERGEREERERGEDRERREEREGREEARFELYQKWCLEWNETLLKNIQGHRVNVHELKEEAMWSDFQAEFALK